MLLAELTSKCRLSENAIARLLSAQNEIFYPSVNKRHSISLYYESPRRYVANETPSALSHWGRKCQAKYSPRNRYFPKLVAGFHWLYLALHPPYQLFSYLLNVQFSNDEVSPWAVLGVAPPLPYPHEKLKVHEMSYFGISVFKIFCLTCPVAYLPNPVGLTPSDYCPLIKHWIRPCNLALFLMRESFSFAPVVLDSQLSRTESKFWN